jgi:ribonucleoside-triphosphate reductase
VLAGGIRRAALISMFSFDDTDMLECKFGNWWELNPQRGRANNSVVLARHMAKKKDFQKIWEKVKASGAGEPGIIFTNDVEYLLNPCAEISLRPFSFCNLTSINAGNLESQEDLNDRAKAASFLGTLQASYTDFHYLREIWKENTEKDSLIGVSLTGIANGDILKLDIKQASLEVVEENKKWAPILGIKPAARCCAVKPEGTLSNVSATSSGIHAWFAPYYIRRIRVGKNEAIYTYLSVMNPELVEDDFFRPESTAIISVPVKAPEGAIYRTETALDLLERVKKFHDDWIMPGHISGPNTHNVSATISVKNNEWDEVGEWMWTNRNCYNGLSVLPYDGGSYKQPPFEEIDESTFKKLYKHLTNVNLEGVVEIEDSTDHKGEVACSGGGCEIK